MELKFKFNHGFYTYVCKGMMCLSPKFDGEEMDMKMPSKFQKRTLD